MMCESSSDARNTDAEVVENPGLLQTINGPLTDEKSLKEIYEVCLLVHSKTLVSHKFEDTAKSLMREATKLGFHRFNEDSRYKNDSVKFTREQIMSYIQPEKWREFVEVPGTSVEESTPHTFNKNCISELILGFQEFVKNQNNNGDQVHSNERNDTPKKEEESEENLVNVEKNISAGDNIGLAKQSELETSQSVPSSSVISKNTELNRKCSHERAINDVETSVASTEKTQLLVTDDDFIELLKFHDNNVLRAIPSKSVQTRISAVKSAKDFLLACDLNRPANIIRSGTLIKHPLVSNPYAQELTLMRSHLYNTRRNYQKLKLRFHKIHADYHKLRRIAGELATVLESSVRGESVDMQAMLNTCFEIFTDLFNQNVRDEADVKVVKDRGHYTHQSIDASSAPRSLLYIAPLSPKLLDFKKIKLHLITENTKTRVLLLQALRQKITLSQPAERDEAVYQYTCSDILGLHGHIVSDSCKSILPCLLITKDIILPCLVQQSTARLLNALASLRCGRDYLAAGPAVLNSVIRCLDKSDDEASDPVVCDMLLAMLQKLSLRKQQRLYMIEVGLVEWLIYHLNTEGHKIGSYRFEYSSALLMNLSLHKQARIKAAAIAMLVISTLTMLLSTKHLSALSYINGALSNFLLNDEINEEAKRIGITSVLEYHRKHTSDEIRNHLNHILAIHRRDSGNNTRNDDSVDDDDNEEMDVLEDELEEGDPVRVQTGELCGEALLSTCYSIISSSVEQPIIASNTHTPKTPKLCSRSLGIKSPMQVQDDLKNVHHINQLPSYNTGLTPRLTVLSNKYRLHLVQTAPEKDVSNSSSLSNVTQVSSAIRKVNQNFEPLVDFKFRQSERDNNMSKLNASSESLKDNKKTMSEVEKSVKNHVNVSTSSAHIFVVESFKNNSKGGSSKAQAEWRNLYESQTKHRTIKSKHNECIYINGNNTALSLSGKKQASPRETTSSSSEKKHPTSFTASQDSKESSKVAMNSSTTLASARESVTEVTGILSSIASLEQENRVASSSGQLKDSGDMEEDVFRAKPKILRTPPQTTRSRNSTGTNKIEPARLTSANN